MDPQWYLKHLAPHQIEALDKLDNGKILWGDVGTGKSRVAAAYYIKVEADADVYVITTAKKRNSLDWEAEFARFGVGKSRDATVAGGVLTVDSWNNIGKYRDVVGAFFIFDEQRLVGSGDWSDTFLKIAKRNRWILLSATPGDVWMDYIPVFVANGFYKNRTEFKREHVIYNTFTKFPKVDRYVGIVKLVRARNALLVEMPYMRKTKRNVQAIKVAYDKSLFEKVVKDRWHVYEDRPIRDIAELFSVMRKVVNSDESRLRSLSTLLERHPRLIVFYNFNYELEALREMLSSIQSSEVSKSMTISAVSLSTDSLSPLSDYSEFEECDGATLERQTRRNKWGLTESKTSLTQTEIDSSTLRTSVSIRGIESKKLSSFKDTQSILPSERETSSTETGSRTTMVESGSGPTTSIPMLGDGGKSATRSADGLEVEISTDGCSERTTSECSFQVAEWNGHKHQAVPDGPRWVYLVQYTAGAEGWNCITTDSTVFFSLPYSYKQFHQAHGRTDRMNTPYETLNYYVLMSNSFIDSAIAKSLAAKKSFNERKYAGNLGKS